MAHHRCRRHLLLVLVVLVAACNGDGDGDGARPDTGEDLVATLVASQPTLPEEPADEVADIVTEPDDLPTVWDRFRMSGDPPAVDLERTALLFVGFGESGSCPATFGGLDAAGDGLSVLIGHEGGPVCTSDFNPRTFVIGVAADLLPAGGFVLDVQGSASGRFSLASAPQDRPPEGPTIVRSFTAEQPQLAVEVEPAADGAGASVEILVHNEGEVSVSAGGWPTRLEVWDRQRWLPAPDQPVFDAHPAVTLLEPATVRAGDRAAVAMLDTTRLEPGWYAVELSLQLGGAGGRVDVRTQVEVAS